MMKIKLRSKSLLVYLIFVWVMLMTTDLVYGQEKRKPFLRTFISDNGKYIVTVQYENWGGKGKAFYILKDKNGNKLSEFEAKVSPRVVEISNNGNRLIAFGGPLIDKYYSYNLCFYDRKGRLLKEHEIEITGGSRHRISQDNKYLIIGYQHRDKAQLALFNIITGELLWKIPLDIRFNGVTVSNKGEWIVITGEQIDPVTKIGTREYKIILFDKKGNKQWEEIVQGVVEIVNISPDGLIFEIEDRTTKVKKKRIYKNYQGKAKLEKVENIEEGGKDKK